MRTVAILGSTGSIGTQALEVIARNRDRLRVGTLCAGTNVELLAHQAREFEPALVAVKSQDEARALSGLLASSKCHPEIVCGTEGTVAAATHPAVDCVVNGLGGALGLAPTIAALRSSRQVLLANKESLVMAGEIIRGIVDSGTGSIVPVDSEHSAIYQCLGGRLDAQGISRIILTASGGPFWRKPLREFESITPGEALAHPTWKMGQKVTIDSATLMNKGLEIIEAHYLFGVPPDRIEVLIHPASIVHSLVEFDDGSVLAQLSHPAMEIPIQYALLAGERRPTTVARLDLSSVGKLEFFPPDSERFPSLDLARAALRAGGTAPAVLNGANEEAVALFLGGKIGFTDIPRIVREVLDVHVAVPATENTVVEADVWARERARSCASSGIPGPGGSC